MRPACVRLVEGAYVGADSGCVVRKSDAGGEDKLAAEQKAFDVGDLENVNPPDTTTE